MGVGGRRKEDMVVAGDFRGEESTCGEQEIGWVVVENKKEGGIDEEVVAVVVRKREEKRELIQGHVVSTITEKERERERDATPEPRLPAWA